MPIHELKLSYHLTYSDTSQIGALEIGPLYRFNIVEQRSSTLILP
jgi:hypothetical protein